MRIVAESPWRGIVLLICGLILRHRHGRSSPSTSTRCSPIPASGCPTAAAGPAAPNRRGWSSSCSAAVIAFGVVATAERHLHAGHQAADQDLHVHLARHRRGAADHRLRGDAHAQGAAARRAADLSTYSSPRPRRQPEQAAAAVAVLSSSSQIAPSGPARLRGCARPSPIGRALRALVPSRSTRISASPESAPMKASPRQCGNIVARIDHQAGGRDRRGPADLGRLEAVAGRVIGDVAAAIMAAVGDDADSRNCCRAATRFELVAALRPHLRVPTAGPGASNARPSRLRWPRLPDLRR